MFKIIQRHKLDLSSTDSSAEMEDMHSLEKENGQVTTMLPLQKLFKIIHRHKLDPKNMSMYDLQQLLQR